MARPRGDTYGGRKSRDRGAGGGAGSGTAAGATTARAIQVSKALSYMLRHGATKEHIELNSAGWANVADVLRWRRLSSISVTLEEIQDLVQSNDKQRFEMKFDPDYGPLPALSPTQQTPSSNRINLDSASAPTDPAAYLIRASQGHSMKHVESDKVLQPFTPGHPHFPRSGYVVHGTYNSAWQKILNTGGLKPMGRNHIHFATGVPPPLPPLDATTTAYRPYKEAQIVNNASDQNHNHNSQSPASGSDGGNSSSSNMIDPLTDYTTGTQLPDGDTVLSGMRRDATVLVWADVQASMEKGGVTWWRSANGVILTEGIAGTLGLEWITWVERRGTGEILWGKKPDSFSPPTTTAPATTTITNNGSNPGLAGQMESLHVTAADQFGGHRDYDESGSRDLARAGDARRGGAAAGRRRKKDTGEVKDNWDD